MCPQFKNTLLTKVIRAVIEIGFIIFLFYANLLMGEYTATNSAHGKTIMQALSDVLTVTNFAIGFIAALIGYLVFEFLRKKFR